MPRTIDQQIAEAENRVQRLKAKKRTKDTRRRGHHPGRVQKQKASQLFGPLAGSLFDTRGG